MTCENNVKYKKGNKSFNYFNQFVYNISAIHKLLSKIQLEKRETEKKF